MKKLETPVLLFEKDASCLYVKDTTDYNGVYPAFTLDNFNQGVRLVVLRNVLTGAFNFYSSVTTLPQTSATAQGNTTVDTTWKVTLDNNMKAVVNMPNLSLTVGEFDMTLVAVAFIPLTGAFNLNYKKNEIAVFTDDAVNYNFLKALKDYPLREDPLNNGDWLLMTSISDDLVELKDQYYKTRIRVEGTEKLNYFNAQPAVTLDCAAETITVVDNSTYWTDELEAFGKSNFNYFTYLKVTNPSDESTIYSSMGLGNTISPPSVSDFEVVVSDVVSGVYKFEYINLPTVLIGAIYRTGDVVYSPFYDKVYICNQDVTVISYAQMLYGFTEVENYEDIPEQYRKIFIQQVLCEELECFSENFYTVFCKSCSECKFCKCKEGKNMASATVLALNLQYKDNAFKTTEQYKELFTDSQTILNQLCDCQ